MRAGNLPRERLDPRLPAVIAAGDLSGDGPSTIISRTPRASTWGTLAPSRANYYEYGKVVLTEMRYLDVLWGGKKFRLR